MTDQPRQITITLDADALDALERYQQAYRAWLNDAQSPEARELSLRVTTSARALAAKIDEVAMWPQEALIIAEMVKDNLAKAKEIK